MWTLKQVSIGVGAVALTVLIGGAGHGAWVRYTGTGSGQGCPFGFTEGERPGVSAEKPASSTNAVRLTGDDVARLHEVAFQAAREGDVQTLTAYLESGFDVNVVNSRGDTLLILATYYGQQDAVALILSRPGVKLDVKNQMGFAALTGAVYKGYDGLVRALIEKGADVNTANGSGQTPLMFAGMFGRAEAARMLVEAGAWIDAADSAGNTATKLALGQGNQEMARLLEDLAGRQGRKP